MPQGEEREPVPVEVPPDVGRSLGRTFGGPARSYRKMDVHRARVLTLFVTHIYKTLIYIYTTVLTVWPFNTFWRTLPITSVYVGPAE